MLKVGDIWIGADGMQYVVVEVKREPGKGTIVISESLPVEGEESPEVQD